MAVPFGGKGTDSLATMRYNILILVRKLSLPRRL